MTSPWEKLLEQPHPGGHFVQLYDTDDAGLARNVCQYLWEGLRRGEAAVVIAEPAHVRLFSRHLRERGARVPELVASRRLLFLDAASTLATFMVNGQPDWTRFEATARAALRAIHPAPGVEGVRAYGEMVGLLWNARQFAAAVRLEQLWNKLLEQVRFSLYCSYAIDIFGKEFEHSRLNGVLCTHTHMMPAGMSGELEAVLNSAMDEVLGSSAAGLRDRIRSQDRPSWAVMPVAERMVLWLRENLPDQVESILRAAGRRYRQLDRSAA